MQTTIAASGYPAVGVNTVNVGSVGIGPITIGQLVLTDFELNTAADGAFLRNFVVTVTYTMKLDWHLHIDLPGNVIDDSGTEDLDSPTFIVGFGDIRLPGYENIKIAIDSLALDNPAATINPVSNIQLGAAVAEQIQAKNLKLPTAGLLAQRARDRRIERRRLRRPGGDARLGHHRQGPRRRHRRLARWPSTIWRCRA